MESLRTWIRSGAPWVWLNAAAVTVSIALVAGLLLLIAARGLGHFWPAAVHEIVYQQADGSRVKLAGQLGSREHVLAARLTEAGREIPEGVETVERMLLKTGNRDLSGTDFRWIYEPSMLQLTQPVSMVVLERQEWGVFFGRLVGLRQDGALLESRDTWADFQGLLARTGQLREQIRDLERGAIGRVNYRLERLRLDERELQLDGVTDPASYADLERQRAELESEYQALERELAVLNESIRRDAMIVQTSAGQEVELPLQTIVDAWMPNAMGG
jgi:phosphate transport system permease protein